MPAVGGRLGRVIFVLTFAVASGRLAWLKHAVKFDLFKAGVHPWGLPCHDPVKRAPVKFPPHLLLGNTRQPMMYSGYVNVTNRDYLFYWFAEAEEKIDDENTPIVVWSNGGPGCSAMEGMTTEHGPLLLLGSKTDPQSSPGRLVHNPYSWNKRAHVLYVDQPRYVGYSCGTGPFISNSMDAGKDMVTFLRGWRLLFPEHAHRSLVLATESYGGHYIPAWSVAISEYNRGASDKFTISGIVIGNGIVNETLQGYSFKEFAKQQALIPENFSSNGVVNIREAIAEKLGYQPNYYDYRLKEMECCGCSSYDYNAWSEFLLRDDVARALHVCGDAGSKAFSNCAAGCISLPEFDADSDFDYSAALGQALSEGIKVTFYFGMRDTACNYLGGFQMASRLDWNGASAFKNAAFQDLQIAGREVGKVKSGGGLTWLQVAGAGHMVPVDDPAAALFALTTVLPSPPNKHSNIPARCPLSPEPEDSIAPVMEQLFSAHTTVLHSGSHLSIAHGVDWDALEAHRILLVLAVSSVLSAALLSVGLSCRRESFRNVVSNSRVLPLEGVWIATCASGEPSAADLHELQALSPDGCSPKTGSEGHRVGAVLSFTESQGCFLCVMW